MAKTSTKVTFGLYDSEIKNSGSPVFAPAHPLSNPSGLIINNVIDHPYATYEPDYWLLNGKYAFLVPNQPNPIGWLSGWLSGEGGDGGDGQPSWNISFSSPTAFSGMTMRFGTASGDYPKRVRLIYRNEYNQDIRDDTYQISVSEFNTKQPVENVKYIQIQFTGTNKAYRRWRLTGYDFGDLIVFDGTQIKQANVIEESDPLSANLIINTCEITLQTNDARFSILNPEGSYARLKENQPLNVYEIVNGSEVYIGKYYLDEWKNKSENEIEFQCVDLLGILDKLSCKGGLWTGATVGSILTNILASAGFPYILDNDLAAKTLSGWLPICTYREALQQIAFAAGGMVSCARSDAIRIFPMPRATDEHTRIISKSQQGTGGTIELRPRITGVEVIGYVFVPTDATIDIFNFAGLPLGDYDIFFDEPMHSLTCTVPGSQILASNANWAKVRLTWELGTGLLKGKRYEREKVSALLIDESDSLVKNILKVSDATLVGENNLLDVTQRIFDYYQQRIKCKLKIFVPVITVGNVIAIDALYGKQIKSVVEKMDIDLTGGFIAKVETVGEVYNALG